MLKPFNFKDKLKTFKVFTAGLILGAIITALLLDNRASALLKAFQNPVAVNGLEFKVEVKK